MTIVYEREESIAHLPCFFALKQRACFQTSSLPPRRATVFSEQPHKVAGVRKAFD
jgi:hypothetical protein